MLSETSPGLSFSNELSQEDDTQIGQVIRRDTSLLGSNSDFEFSICSSLDHEPTSADELFAHGMILPVQIQDSAVAPRQILGYKTLAKVTLPPLPCPESNETQKKESMRKLLVVNSESEEKPQPKSFWGFKRSSSLNCDIRKSICPLPLLSRSNSTGSVANTKRTAQKDHHRKHSLLKQQSNYSVNSSSSSSSYSTVQKPPLKKNYGGAHGNGVRISPVLNVPPPHISKRTANLFGLGSFLGNLKENKNRN